jgi:NADPH:quinone reductase-like Zn-dependent oxidoreductase
MFNSKITYFYIKVLHIEQMELGEWDGKSALVRWLASPVNPVDLYIIRGQYGGYKPKLPAIAGVEAVGIVEKVGT